MSRARAIRRAAELGCTIEDNGDELTLTAPKGQALTGCGLERTVHAKWDNDTRAALWASVLADMADGIEPSAEDSEFWSTL